VNNAIAQAWYLSYSREKHIQTNNSEEIEACEVGAFIKDNRSGAPPENFYCTGSGLIEYLRKK